MAEPSPEYNALTGQIVDAAYAVHTALGPGLLEAVYDRFLAFELQDRGIQVDRQVNVVLIKYGIRRLINSC